MLSVMVLWDRSSPSSVRLDKMLVSWGGTSPPETTQKVGQLRRLDSKSCTVKTMPTAMCPQLKNYYWMHKIFTSENFYSNNILPFYTNTNTSSQLPVIHSWSIYQCTKSFTVLKIWSLWLVKDGHIYFNIIIQSSLSNPTPEKSVSLSYPTLIFIPLGQFSLCFTHKILD